MKSFSSWLKKLNKKYVGLYFTPESEEKLRDWAVRRGFDLTFNFDGSKQNETDYDFHTTVYFTSSEHDTTNGNFSIEPFELKVSGFELLGMNKDVPVLVVDTDNADLMKLRKRFESFGYKDNWPTYKPHISLSYKYSGVPKLEELDLPSFKIIASSIKIEDQK